MATKSKAGIPTNVPVYNQLYGQSNSSNNSNNNLKTNNVVSSNTMLNRVTNDIKSSNNFSYLPTTGATSSNYLKLANDPLSANIDPNSLTYSAVTRNGSSYIPTVNSRNNETFDLDISGRGSYGGYSSGGGISGRANFQASDAYNEAMAYTNQLLSQLSSGRTSYTDQINSLMDSINNRAAFSYDVDNDPLFQQYLASSMDSGKMAMQDTMAQASALTGGYGSTYATAAANGAYNSYIQDAYNNLPEYYEMALNAYNTETDNLYNKLNMYSVADETEYNRLQNAYTNNLNAANDMYSKEYNDYYDALNYNTSVDQYNADLAYKYASLAEDQYQYDTNLKYQKSQDAYNRAQNSVASNTTTEASDLDYDYAEGLINRAIANGGYNSASVDNQIAQLANMGYDIDRLITYADGGERDKSSVINNSSNNFVLVSGKNTKDDAVYQDSYGNTYTYKELINSGVDKSRIKA